MRKTKIIWFLLGFLSGGIAFFLGIFLFAKFVIPKKLKENLRPPKIEVSHTRKISNGLTLFKLDDLENAVNIDYGNVLFVNRWEYWCAPCIAEMSSVEKLKDKYTSKGVDFFIVSTENVKKTKEKSKQFDLPFFHQEGKLPSDFNRSGVPYTFILKDSMVVYEHKGAVNWNSEVVYKLLDSLTAN